MTLTKMRRSEYCKQRSEIFGNKQKRPLPPKVGAHVVKDAKDTREAVLPLRHRLRLRASLGLGLVRQLLSSSLGLVRQLFSVCLLGTLGGEMMCVDLLRGEVLRLPLLVLLLNRCCLLLDRRCLLLDRRELLLLLLAGRRATIGGDLGARLPAVPDVLHEGDTLLKDRRVANRRSLGELLGCLASDAVQIGLRLQTSRLDRSVLADGRVIEGRAARRVVLVLREMVVTGDLRRGPKRRRSARVRSWAPSVDGPHLFAAAVAPEDAAVGARHLVAAVLLERRDLALGAVLDQRGRHCLFDGVHRRERFGLGRLFARERDVVVLPGSDAGSAVAFFPQRGEHAGGLTSLH